MRTIKFQIRLHTGQIDQLSMEAERVLIGSGAHCEIRLPVDQARVEHVLIELGPAGIFARALNFDPPPTINNIPFQQAPLPPGAVLGVGGCQILRVAEGAAGGPWPEEEDEPDDDIAMAIIVPSACTPSSDDAAEARRPRPAGPELWQAAVAACPYSGSQALAFAREKMAVADAKRERRPFHVQDGVQAVPTYEAAAVCFRAGGDNGSGNLAEESAKFLRRDITDDFRTRRVRLDHAGGEDHVSAQGSPGSPTIQRASGRLHHMAVVSKQVELKAGAKNRSRAHLCLPALGESSLQPTTPAEKAQADMDVQGGHDGQALDRGKAFASMGDTRAPVPRGRLEQGADRARSSPAPPGLRPDRALPLGDQHAENHLEASRRRARFVVGTLYVAIGRPRTPRESRDCRAHVPDARRTARSRSSGQRERRVGADRHFASISASTRWRAHRRSTRLA
ncbi:MAG: hypothetical protein WKG00_05555 [Polyangiaceae bacterium]